MKRNILAAMAAMFVLGLSLHAQDSTALVARARNASDALRGFTGFNLTVGLHSSADTLALRKGIEAKLQENNIRVSNREIAALEIVCMALENPSVVTVVWACSMRVSQAVTRTLPTPMQLVAKIWQTNPEVRSATKANFKAMFAAGVEEMTDKFLEDWVAANPKK